MCNKQLYFSLYEGLVSFHTVEYRLVLKICDYDTPLLFIKINPRILVEEDHSYLGIFHATAENIEKIYSKASAIVHEYVPGYSLEDASLCRVDLCLNITCNQPDALIQLIACLKRCDWRSQYQTTEFSAHTRNAEEKNKHSFRILSKHFSLTVYDKLFERTQRSSLEPEHPDGLLRVEFGLQDEMAIGYYLHDAAMTDREKLIFPFFMVLGYNTYDMREFQSYINRAAFYPDYVVKKWDSSKLCKRALSIKYIPFKDNAVDFDKKIFDDSAAGCKLDELMDKLYFKSDYYVITNGYLYVFFNKKRRTGSKNFEFCFNLKNYSKKDAAQLAFYSKQYLFLEISDVYRS